VLSSGPSGARFFLRAFQSAGGRADIRGVVKLVPFPAKYLRLNEPLPFGLRDAEGRLLLAAGQAITLKARLVELTSQPLFGEEAESADWRRRLAAATDLALRQGATLAAVAEARPEALPAREQTQAAPVTQSLAAQWDDLVAQLDLALRDVRPGNGEWRARLFAVHGRARQVFQRRPDASLYHLVYEAGHSTQKYSCHHALLALLMGEQAAAMLAWPQNWIDSLGRAALTMNVAMLRLQDQLAATEKPPSPEQRAEIDAHPETGAQLLQAAGLGDPLAIAVVRLHHDGSRAAEPLAGLPPERAIARLLRRVDIFSAKISRRASRSPMSPVQAAREACLGPGGVPDEIGGALLKAVGLYPPGSFVELTSGELGIVLARGRRANLPFVAALVSASGNPLMEPALRDTLDRRYAVKSAVAPSAVKVRPQHERILALR
jgi:HD-GYP domain-containing protein (c-di-GMP phosphodiesterase class II)